MTHLYKNLIKNIILQNKSFIDAKQFDKVFQNILLIPDKELFLKFLLNFGDRNEWLGLVHPFPASNLEIVDVVGKTLNLLKSAKDLGIKEDEFLFLERVLSEGSLADVARDEQSKAAYVSALHLVGIPKIYDVDDGKGFWRKGPDYLIGDGQVPLDEWVKLQKETYDVNFDTSNFRRLW